MLHRILRPDLPTVSLFSNINSATQPISWILWSQVCLLIPVSCPHLLSLRTLIMLTPCSQEAGSTDYAPTSTGSQWAIFFSFDYTCQLLVMAPLSCSPGETTLLLHSLHCLQQTLYHPHPQGTPGIQSLTWPMGLPTLFPEPSCHQPQQTPTSLQQSLLWLQNVHCGWYLSLAILCSLFFFF